MHLVRNEQCFNKLRDIPHNVMPVKAGIQNYILDSLFRGNDKVEKKDHAQGGRQLLFKMW